MTTLSQTTANLRSDRIHLEEALICLRQNEPIESSNSLAAVLNAQFLKIESEIDRSRSIALIDRLMSQLLLDLESHERALLAAGNRVNNGVERLKALKFRLDGKTSEAKALLEEISQLSQSLEADRLEVGHLKPLARISGTFLSPVVEI